MGTEKGTRKWENSILISDNISPYNVMSVMQANEEENFQMKSIKSACTSLEKRLISLVQEWMFMSAHIWRRLLWLCKSCTKCQECSSLFARASQIPIQDWQLGLFGESDVGWIFGVGSVATAGMMQELKCSCEVPGPSWWLCRTSPWAELHLLWEQWV